MSITTPADAQRNILLAGQAVDYVLRRSHRRSIGLSIDQRGLRVAAPKQTRLADIESLLRQHSQWVLDKLSTWQTRPAPPKLQLSDGACFFAVGEPHTLLLRPASRPCARFIGASLLLESDTPEHTARYFEKALRDKARQIFSQRLMLYAIRLGVPEPPLRLSSARTRWGSCSARGGIALNWKLIFLPLRVIDYVVCHELAHLKEMNHSPRFWSVVEQLCPDWRSLRLELRQLGRQIPEFE